MLLVVCGPPGVGKTTVAEELQRRLAERGHEFGILHSDDFSRRTYARMYECVADAGPAEETDADAETDWILDGTFYRREYQERFRNLPDAHLIYLTAGRETALKRNRERANPIEEDGLHAMHAKFEEPKQPDLTLDTDELSVEEAVEALERYVLTWLHDG